VIGVIQLINKTTGGGVFTSDDEDIMNIFLSIAGPILAESSLYEKIQVRYWAVMVYFLAIAVALLLCVLHFVITT
jgi:hypothetical protein